MGLLTIGEIIDGIGQCEGCHLHKHLATECTPTPGHGNSNADLMFVAEAPGENEMLTGIPLVGLAGQLFDKLLDQAGIIRKDCWIDNIVHCRPTEDNKGFKNRPPTDEEIKACKGWIWEAIQVVNPKVIVTMGKVPTYTLLHSQLNKTFTMKSVVGQEFKVDYFPAIIIPVYHPSHLLQHGKKHIDATIDIFKKAKSLLISEHDNWANTLPKDKPRKK